VRLSALLSRLGDGTLTLTPRTLYVVSRKLICIIDSPSLLAAADYIYYDSTSCTGN
jgi:hypothetical protein